MINIIGLGYIGLPTSLMMASHGVKVVGTDYNKELVDTLNAGKTTFYGIAYKENVDDYRESPTLQLLEVQETCLANPLKCYDPFITKNVVKNQYHNLDDFLEDIDLIVIMVKHDEIVNNWNKIENKIILDCHNICPLKGTYHL